MTDRRQERAALALYLESVRSARSTDLVVRRDDPSDFPDFVLLDTLTDRESWVEIVEAVESGELIATERRALRLCDAASREYRARGEEVVLTVSHRGVEGVTSSPGFGVTGVVIPAPARRISPPEWIARALARKGRADRYGPAERARTTLVIDCSRELLIGREDAVDVRAELEGNTLGIRRGLVRLGDLDAAAWPPPRPVARFRFRWPADRMITFNCERLLRRHREFNLPRSRGAVRAWESLTTFQPGAAAVSRTPSCGAGGLGQPRAVFSRAPRMSDEFVMGDFSGYDDSDISLDEALGSDYQPTEADCVDMVRPSQTELVEEDAYHRSEEAETRSARKRRLAENRRYLMPVMLIDLESGVVSFRDHSGRLRMMRGLEAVHAHLLKSQLSHCRRMHRPVVHWTCRQRRGPSHHRASAARAPDDGGGGPPYPPVGLRLDLVCPASRHPSRPSAQNPLLKALLSRHRPTGLSRMLGLTAAEAGSSPETVL